MIAVLGAGIAGISAAYHLGLAGKKCTVFEKDADWGGLCGNFNVADFRFDKAIHLSFAEDEYVKRLFSESCGFHTHIPDPFNYYKGFWLKHPAQNNLAPLPTDEKISIIADFIAEKPQKTIENYEDWLKAQYGTYFSENFPMRYTRKYWTCEAKDLSVSWVGGRMYTPDIKEVLRGAFETETPHTYYAKEMRYPVSGGYKSFLRKMAQQCDIRLSQGITGIDTGNRTLRLSTGESFSYNTLVSSIPLPEYPRMIRDMPEIVINACNRLQWTSVGLVSFGFNRPDVPKNLWFYVYDEDIPFARCYSPSVKSPDNAPQGCSSLQMEVYFSKNKPIQSETGNFIEICAEFLEKAELIDRNDITVKDFRTVEYGNVIFYHGMEQDRQLVLNYLKSVDITTIGRFGRWDYLWSDQSLLSGFEHTKDIA